MTVYQCQDMLEPRAAQFIEQLRTEGIDTELLFFRDYMVKIRVANIGSMKIHYSPKRDSFTFDPGELHDKTLTPVLQGVYQAIFSPASVKSTPLDSSEHLSLQKVDYYYQTLSPYRNLSFDFVVLADALAEAAEQFKYDAEAAQARQAHYEFDSLEGLYLQLKKVISHHDK